MSKNILAHGVEVNKKMRFFVKNFAECHGAGSGARKSLHVRDLGYVGYATNRMGFGRRDQAQLGIVIERAPQAVARYTRRLR